MQLVEREDMEDEEDLFEAIDKRNFSKLSFSFSRSTFKKTISVFHFHFWFIFRLQFTFLHNKSIRIVYNNHPLLYSFSFAPIFRKFWRIYLYSFVKQLNQVVKAEFYTNLIIA